MLTGIHFNLFWFEDGSSILLDSLIEDLDGKKHLALTDSNGICPLHDFLCFDYVKAGREEVIGLILHEYPTIQNVASVVKKEDNYEVI